MDGYTLLELLVVVAIMGLIAALAAPAASRTIASATLNADARKAAGDLRALQHLAMERQEAITLTATGGTVAISPAGTVQDIAALPLSAGNDAITYYPDGTTSGGTLRLSESGHALVIDIAWLTGTINMRPADGAP